MLTAPLFGYLGDRYSRKWILVFGLSMWSLSTLVGSLQRNFIAFMAFRALVGIGEASYSTIGKNTKKEMCIIIRIKISAENSYMTIVIGKFLHSSSSNDIRSF